MQVPDAFYLFRNLLFVALTVYTVITMAHTAWQVGRLLHGDDPRRRLLRVYLSYQLLSFRVQPLWGELLQIAFWCTILAWLWWLHQTMG